MNLLKQMAIIFFNLIDNFVHQRRILNFLKRNNMKVKSFMDIGAHKGLYTDLLLKNYDIKNIYMLEPQKNFFDYLKKKYKKNKKISIYNAAASDKNGLQKIFINKHDLTSGLNKINKDNFYLKIKARLFGGNVNEMITKTYKIKTIKLLEIFKKKRLKFIDMIKIDTEGHELNVLKGLSRNISSIKIILIEFHSNEIYENYNSNKIHNYLIKNKFRLRKIIKFPFTKWEDRFYVKH